MLSAPVCQKAESTSDGSEATSSPKGLRVQMAFLRTGNLYGHILLAFLEAPMLILGCMCMYPVRESSWKLGLYTRQKMNRLRDSYFSKERWFHLTLCLGAARTIREVTASAARTSLTENLWGTIQCDITDREKRRKDPRHPRS